MTPRLSSDYLESPSRVEVIGQLDTQRAVASVYPQIFEIARRYRLLSQDHAPQMKLE